MLILLRHGRTEANRSGLLQGRVDNPLDSHGEKQAAAAAAHLHSTVPGGIQRVIASPLRRAQQTAAALGIDVETDERFIELNYGDWEERPVSEVPTDVWKQWRADLDFRPPGGETLNELGARVREAAESLAADASERNVVVVSHVSPMKAMMAWALGVPDEVTWHMYVNQASICRVDFRGARPILASMNERASSASI